MDRLDAFFPVLSAHVEFAVALALTVLGREEEAGVHSRPSLPGEDEWQLCASLAVQDAEDGSRTCAACLQAVLPHEDSYCCPVCAQAATSRHFHPACWLHFEVQRSVFECPACKTHLVG